MPGPAGYRCCGDMRIRPLSPPLFSCRGDKAFLKKTVSPHLRGVLNELQRQSFFSKITVLWKDIPTSFEVFSILIILMTF
jgi:hypothetical protein